MNSIQPHLKRTFQAFGLNFSYDSDFPSYIETKNSQDEIQVFENLDLSRFMNEDGYLNLNESIFKKPGIFTSYSSIANGISYYFNKDLPLDSLDKFCKVMTHPAAMYLFQLKDYVLHCSAVEKDGKAYLFVGPSGSGKSYLSGMLLDNCSLITEDVGRINFKNDEGYIYPGLPFLKITDHFHKKHKIDCHEKFNITGDLRQRDGLMVKNFSSPLESLRIDKCYFLEKSNIQDIEGVEPIDSFKHLILNSFRPFPRNASIDSEKVLLKNIGKLIKSTRFFKYKRSEKDDTSLLLKHMDI